MRTTLIISKQDIISYQAQLSASLRWILLPQTCFLHDIDMNQNHVKTI